MQAISGKVTDLLERETAIGMDRVAYYRGFQEQANKVKNDFLAFLLKAARLEKTVVGYGAAAKGSTLLNYAGVRPDLLAYVVDKNPNKQGKYLPGSRIPIVPEDHIIEQRPDYVVILPWNIKGEIMAHLSYIREWDGKFVTAVPCLEVS